MNLVRRAIEEPLRQIARNAGAEGSVVVEKVRAGKGGFGFNAATDTYEDLVKAGVIDPAKVVRSALEFAASVAGMMLTTEAVIADKPKKEKAARRRGWRRRAWAEWAAWAGWAAWVEWAAATSTWIDVRRTLVRQRGGAPMRGSARGFVACGFASVKRPPMHSLLSCPRISSYALRGGA